AEPLPFKEIYNLIGIDFKEQIINENESETGLRYYLSEKGFTILKCSEGAQKLGLKKGDIVKSVNGQPFNEDTIGDIKKMWSQLKPSDSYDISIIRDDETIDLEAMMFPRVTNFVFSMDENATDQAKALFNVWSESL
ncbi:MAG: PDZ domain-containing protein, partial [Flavobacteriaceae bacterium]|nr:PDZ domain-containing protein [Flavobacteriaceae bacterium]